MKVIHVHSGNLYGGVETTLMAQVRNAHLCPQMSLSFALCFEGRFSEELHDEHADVTFIGHCRIRNPISISTARTRLRELLRLKQPDVVITHSAWSQSLFGPIINAARTPIVSWVHGRANPKHWLEAWARKTRPSLIIANSHFTALSVSSVYPGIRAEVIYNPLVNGQAFSLRASGVEARKALGIPLETFVIIQVSRMETCKGHEILLKALVELRGLDNWICLQVGGPQRKHESIYENSLKSLAAELGISDRIVFLGERSDVRNLLAAADILCQPNIGPETFGNVFIEGMVAGVPVVTTAIGGALEIIDEGCGVLIPPNDSSALALTLRSLIKDAGKRESLSRNGPQRAQALCGVEKQMGKIAQVLESVFTPGIN
jgi:glycosyltransferase involved in cell wall biosynthesis